MAGASSETIYFAGVGVGATIYFSLDSPTSTTTTFVTGATLSGPGGDLQISNDGGAFSNCANSASEIATSSGIYKLVLTAGELTAVTDVLIRVHKPATCADKLIHLIVQVQIGGVTITPATGQRSIFEASGSTLGVLRANRTVTSSATTITLDAAANATDNYYNEAQIYLSTGTGAGQSRTIVSYVGATKVATVNRAWVTNPDNTTNFVVRPGGDVWDQLDGAQPTGPTTGANVTFRRDMQVLRRRFYNKVTQTVSTQTVFQDDNATPMTLMAVADDSVTQTKAQST